MGDPLKSLEGLGVEVERMVRSSATARRRRRFAPRMLLLSAAGLGATAAVAVAAGGLLTGAPVEPPKGSVSKPHSGLGVPSDDGTTLSALRVEDPAGGPPWGLRTTTTSRGFVCIQVGRVVEDRLGVLGQDGAFDNDGLFHPFTTAVLDGLGCQRPDAKGNAFVAISYQGLPASAHPGDCVVGKRSSGAPAATVSTCPREDLRILYYGLLGPKGKNVTYPLPGGRQATAAAVGPRRAYLVVTRPGTRRPATGMIVPAPTPRSGLLSVAYTDGSTCKIRDPRAIGGAKPCPLKGYVERPEQQLTSADVASPVRVSVAPKLVHPVRGGPASRRLTVRFRARVAAGTGRTYIVTARPQLGPGCNAYEMTSPVARDIKAGSVVTQTVDLQPDCRTRVTGQVVLHVAKPVEQIPLGGLAQKTDPVVGRFSASLP